MTAAPLPADVRERLGARGLVVAAHPDGGYLVGRLFDVFGATRDGVPTEHTLLEARRLSWPDVAELAAAA